MATPRHWKRRGRFALILAVAVGSMIAAAMAFGAVKTDAYYYNYGATVQITGDSMTPGETVTVDITAPDSSLVQEHLVQADNNGAYTDSYVIPLDALPGVYTVTATGEKSGNVDTTTFDPPAPATTTTLTLTPGISTGNAGEVYYGGALTFSGTVSATDNSLNPINRGTVEVLQSKERKANICQNGPDFGGTTTIYSQTPSGGAFSSGAFDPKLHAFPATNFAAGNYYVSNQSLPAATYADAVGQYAFQANFDDSGPGQFGSSSDQCEQVSVVKAPTTTTASLTSNSIPLGSTTNVYYDIVSAYGISPNTMNGTATVEKLSGPGNLNCLDGSSNATTGVSKAESNADGGGASDAGFHFTANGSTNTGNAFTCTPSAAGSYTLRVDFTDNSESATNPDGNYQDSHSDSTGLTVTLNVLPSSATLACHYHTGTSDSGTSYTNGLANSAWVTPTTKTTTGSPTNFVVHCVVMVSNGSITNFKVQGGLTNSMKQNPSYSFISDTCGTTSHKIDTSKNNNVVTSIGSTLSSSCDVKVQVTNATWGATGLQGLSGGWSVVYTNSSNAQIRYDDPNTPLQVNVHA